jgi:hypothetical protein
MKVWCLLAIGWLAIADVNGAVAQPSSLRNPPRIKPPAGIDPADAILPGQRQPAPIFALPPAREQAAPNPAKPADPTKQPVTPPQFGPGSSPSAPSSTPPENPPAAEPKKIPGDESSPNATAVPPAGTERDVVLPPTGTYVPGGMQGPACFAPNGGLPPLRPGVGGVGPPPVYNPFGAALVAPPYGLPPVVPSGDGDKPCSRCERCCCERCCCDPYFFGLVGGLIMGRNDPNRAWLSAQKSDYANQIMNGADAAAPWTGGYEASFGWMSPTCGALAFTYWGLAPTTGFDYVRLPGDLVTPINLNDVNIGGVGADYFYDNAQEHRVWRYDEINNVEVNFLGLPTSRPNSSLQVSWLAGVRYFRFRDRLVFGAVHEGFEFGSDGGVNEAYLDVATANNLIGGQVGAFVNWLVGPRWGVFLFPRVGVYANNIDQHFQLYRGDGLSSIDIATQKTVGSLIGQIDLGVNYFFTPNWGVYVGYRVMAAGGVGLADAQIPAFLIDTPEIKAIESNGNLILQGATAGILWMF